jgi:hypothetical protein
MVKECYILRIPVGVVLTGVRKLYNIVVSKITETEKGRQFRKNGS